MLFISICNSAQMYTTLILSKNMSFSYISTKLKQLCHIINILYYRSELVCST